MLAQHFAQAPVTIMVIIPDLNAILVVAIVRDLPETKVVTGLV